MRARRAIRAAVLTAAMLAVASPLAAQTRADLEKARASYLARNYAEAEDRLHVLVDSTTGFKERSLLSEARMYLGAVLLAQGRRAQAEEVFEKLILADITYDPDPLSFPGDVINTFIDTRAQLQERIKTAAQTAAKLEAERKAREEAERKAREQWLEKLKAQASEERSTVRNSRLVAFLPFGAGQFQNRRPVLGWIFLGAEAALAIGTAVSVLPYRYALDRAKEVGNSFDEPRQRAYEDRADQIAIVNLSLFGAFVVVAGAGIVQANVEYVPEVVEVKKRDLPALSALSPVIAPVARQDGSPSGVFVGLKGATF
jgi:hypothetical protein